MYLLDEVTKEIQKDRLREADIERLLKPDREQAGTLQAQLLARLGDFLIISGLKLRGDYAPHPKIAWKDR